MCRGRFQRVGFVGFGKDAQETGRDFRACRIGAASLEQANMGGRSYIPEGLDLPELLELLILGVLFLKWFVELFEKIFLDFGARVHRRGQWHGDLLDAGEE